MNKKDNKKGTRTAHAFSWCTQHCLIPILSVIIGITLNNYYQEKKQPNLVIYKSECQTTKLSEEKFSIKCPFKMVNNGGSILERKKVTFLIPRSTTIDAIEILDEYKSFYDISDGGLGEYYVVISVDIPKDKVIEGSIIFYSNIDIPTESMDPLNIVF